MHIAGNHGKVVMESGGRQNRINEWDARAAAFHFSHEHPPPVRYERVYGQDAAGKTLSKIHVEPFLQFRASLARG